MELSIGILGAGFAAVHVRSLLAQEGVKIRAVCATSAEKAARFIEQTGAREAHPFGDFDEMLAQTRLDALYVCIPPHAHCGQVEKAAERGIHLFLEKPIAFDVAGAERQVEAIRRAGVVSQVGYHNRFRESVQMLKNLAEVGQIGAPTLFQGRYWCNMLGADWWRSRDGSRGQVFEQVIHLYDLALHLFGEPESVCAFAGNLVHRHLPDYTIEDTSAATIRFQNGALASIIGSNTAMPGHYLGDFRAVYEKAVLDYRSTGQEWVTPPQATLYDYRAEPLTTREIIETRDPYLAETEAFLAAIRGQAAPLVPVEEGARGVRLVSAVLESAQKDGQPVRL